jgi:hypothetical protein
LAVTGALVGLIWVIQIVQSPGFASVGAAEFARFHAEHSARITVVVGPLMLAEVLAAAWLVAEAGDGEARAWAWACVVPVALAWLSTAFVQVPLHGALSANDPGARAALVETLRRHAGTPLPIAYTGAALTRRVITPTRVGRQRVEAWCHLRQATRTFRVDRIHLDA